MRILPGACLASIQRTLGLWRAREQKLDFWGRHKERVSKFLKAAASAAQPANGTELCDFGVELSIQSAKLGARREIEARHGEHSGGDVIRHWGVFEMDDTISSTEYSLPRPEPGQISQTWSQSADVSTFSGQNGQVRH